MFNFQVTILKYITTKMTRTYVLGFVSDITYMNKIIQTIIYSKHKNIYPVEESIKCCFIINIRRHLFPR